MATKPKTAPAPRKESGLTVPGELYGHGDDLPLPEVTEKNSESVWALWSDLVEKTETRDDHKDFKETVPMDFDSMETARMPLPENPKDKGN